MDLPTFDLQQVVDTFRFIEMVNRWFGGNAALLSFFRRESQTWECGRTYRMLDVGCGVGDSAAALARWGRNHGHRLQIEAIDNNPLTVDLAGRNCRPYHEIALACRDVFHLDGPQYDYVLTSMFLHHFPDVRVPAVLEQLLSLCRLKLVVNDLIRAPLAYCGTWLFTLLTSAVFRHDARLSVRKGFLLPELQRLLCSHGFGGFRLERHFFYRFLLIIDKEASSLRPCTCTSSD
jgi:hypothetical protein